jgi:phage-related protein
LKVKEPYVKPIAGSRKLFEIRIKDRSNIHRIFYFALRARDLYCFMDLQRKRVKHPARKF